VALAGVVVLPLSAVAEGAGEDWPMLGGSPDRNQVSTMTGAPTDWDVETGKNVKWVAELGSQTYANPVIAGGMVFIGTNNDAPRDPKVTGDRGVLMAFRESDGEFLWQAVSDKLEIGAAQDWPEVGVCSTPLVEGDRLYYINNRDELVCLDTRGFADGENDGPFKEEVLKGEKDADVIWKLDMIKELGVFPHNASNSSPVALGKLLYLGTSNGRSEDHATVPSPEAPSLLAVDKETGRVVWSDNSPGSNIMNGQWTSPTVAKIGGVDQVITGQGDGWIRSFDAVTGKKLWEFNTNPPDSVYPDNRNEVLGTVVAWKDHVFIANGQDPENGEGEGSLVCIDATQRGDITSTGKVWEYTEIRRSISTPAIHNGLIYYPDFSGFLHCLDVKTGEKKWVHDTFAAVWASPIVIGDLVFLGDEDGDMAILKAGPKEEVVAEIYMGSSVYSSVVPANGVIFLATRNKLYAIGP
jgi:outer membrane protein assembly factor BamB